MKPQKVIEQFANEGNNLQIWFKYGASLVGSDIGFYAYDSEGNEIAIGFVNGAGANVAQSVELATGLLDVGRYEIEVWKDKDGAGELLIYPDVNVLWRIIVQDRNGASVEEVGETFDETFDLTFD